MQGRLFPLALAACVTACTQLLDGTTTTTTSTTTSTLSGVSVRAESVVGDRGCSAREGAVYKYAVVLRAVDADGGTGAPIASGVYDCFADAVFGDVDGTDAAGFALDVFAFDASGYQARATDVTAAASSLDPAALLSLSTYHGTCEAPNAPGVRSVAACDPLRPTRP